MLVDADNFDCPECRHMFDEEELRQLMMEPFNGIVVECSECGAEISATIKIEMTVLSTKEADDEPTQPNAL